MGASLGYQRWLKTLKLEDTIDNFVAIAENERFVACDDPRPESGYEKIVLYFTDNEDRPFWHAARVVTSDKWMSKLCAHSDFEHNADAFDDVVTWGKARKYMKRRMRDG
jgi:hypothetical protein